MGDVWVCWRCQGMDDFSRVCDLSVGGLFLSTPASPPLGAKAKLDFLVQEGQIRAEAVVRHLVPGGGLGFEIHSDTRQRLPATGGATRQDSHTVVYSEGPFIRSAIP